MEIVDITGGGSWKVEPSARQVVLFTEKWKNRNPPARVVEMWVMGRESSMLLDLGMCRGTLQGSGGSSSGSCRSAGLSVSSVLLG